MGTVSKARCFGSLSPKERVRLMAKNIFLGTVLIDLFTCRKGSYAGISLEIFFWPRTSRINVWPEQAFLSSLFFSLPTHFLPSFSHSFSLSTFPPSCLFFPSNFIFPFSISFVMSYDPGSHLRKYLTLCTFILTSVKGVREVSYQPPDYLQKLDLALHLP